MKLHTPLLSVSLLATSLALTPAAFAQATEGAYFKTPPMPVQHSNTVTLQDGPDSQRTVTTIQAPPKETVILNKTTIYGQQLAGLLKDRPDAKRFYNLLVTTGLDAPLDKGFTAFIPVDSAFSGTTVGTTYTAGVIDPAARAFLKQHVVEGKHPADLLHGTKDQLTTLAGTEVTLSKAGAFSYYANDVRIKDTVKTPQGILYFIGEDIAR